MDAKTLEALKASIAKWERNAGCSKPIEFAVGCSSCELCYLFHLRYSGGHGCIGCPVAAAGYPYCEGSPYDNATDAREGWLDDPASEISRELAHSAAREEVAFLKSLLPAEEQSNA